MRVLLVTDWMRHAGGAERYVGQVRDGLLAAGDEVRLLTASTGTAGDGRADFVAWGTESLPLQSVVQIVNPRALATAGAARRRFAPDVVYAAMFANHLSPAIFTAFAGVPTVLVATDFKLVCPTFAKTLPDGSTCASPPGWVCRTAGCVGTAHWLRDQLRYAAIRAVVRRARSLLACSERVRVELARGGFEALHLPLPVEPPSPAWSRRPAGEPLFVFSGRLARQKGIFGLARAFARLHRELPTARLRFVGDGPDRAALEREIAALGVATAVELDGWLSPAGVERRMADAWALVAPTIGPEPLGLVALEAIVRAVPVIATRNGGFVETVRDGESGLLVDDGNEEGLLNAMRRIATRRDFPQQRVPAPLVARVSERHDLARHVAALRRTLAAAAGGARDESSAGYGMP